MDVIYRSTMEPFPRQCKNYTVNDTIKKIRSHYFWKVNQKEKYMSAGLNEHIIALKSLQADGKQASYFMKDSI
ncbi:hypothetical protein Fmac_002238 [Flemingia macrophylla]|uniref:Uncharacterized protein n=1 Tax=Flemingia macrophylla TaxID=520843 RepID=A0ABD1NJC5_9FABA